MRVAKCEMLNAKCEMRYGYSDVIVRISLLDGMLDFLDGRGTCTKLVRERLQYNSR
jgi:hypothetical protein